MTRTSREWWDETKADEVALRAWLRDQLRGEASAAGRIEMVRDRYAREGTRAHRLLTTIADQERRHASWVAGLLEARGEPAVIEAKESRYWSGPLAAIEDLETACAVGAHAERMRLARIEAIAADPDAPPDVRAVFARILPEERFHERAFRSLASPSALEATRDAHELGRAALGLAP